MAMTYPPERLKAIRMSFDHPLSPSPRISSVSIHYETHMLGHWTEGEQIQEKGRSESVQTAESRCECS